MAMVYGERWHCKIEAIVSAERYSCLESRTMLQCRHGGWALLRMYPLWLKVCDITLESVAETSYKAQQGQAEKH